MVTTADGQVTLRTIECAGGCGRAPVVVVDHVYHEPVRAEDVSGSSRSSVLRLPESSRGDRRTATSRASTSTSRSAATSSRRRARWSADAVVDEITAATPADEARGSRRVGRPPPREGTCQPVYLVVNADESEPGAFKDRDVMRFTRTASSRAASSRRTASVRERVRLHPGRVPARVRGDARRSRTRARRSWTASRSSSTAAPARTSAARRRRSSSRSRASAASLGRGRPSRPSRASMARRRRSTT